MSFRTGFLAEGLGDAAHLDVRLAVGAGEGGCHLGESSDGFCPVRSGSAP